ncbi:MAG: Rieske 2Fe-2S domain-containing protein [Rhodospirillaceae bacterium]|nr:Rieske 2Fe-2S domain-containing protein [Rhodospirillaceae bacterium]MYH37583.1 Rieske 2Fe-2S domain-containing protein [Rhodospirillaceae bacterium]MYK14692.1 Rieske 2Fe-2S domain-containing protein [Rhodospirillaceae bacterium]
MDRATEIELLEELAGLREARSFYLDDAVTAWPVARYTCPDRFAREMQALFHTMPAVAAHSSELAGPDAFLTRDHAGLPLLLTRDRAGAVHAFLNVCRHRGTRLVGAAKGCRRRFTCPYHAWTYDNRGALTGITHGKAGFPGIDRAELGLRRLGCTEAHGWIWIAPGTGAAPDIDGFLGGLAADFGWLGADGLRIVHEERREWAANWKILYEGGLESYHFRIAHKDTIGPFFQDNLSSYRMFGRHIRSILPRARLDAEMALPEDSRSLRRATNLVYSIFPSSQLLVQEDHIVWIQSLPTAPDRTLVRLATLAPADFDPSDPEADTEAARQSNRHWRKNHEITARTLSEDFAIGESIQSGLSSGANADLHFGRFEGALDRFNRIVEEELAAAGQSM